MSYIPRHSVIPHHSTLLTSLFLEENFIMRIQHTSKRQKQLIMPKLFENRAIRQTYFRKTFLALITSPPNRFTLRNLIENLYRYGILQGSLSAFSWLNCLTSTHGCVYVDGFYLNPSCIHLQCKNSKEARFNDSHYTSFIDIRRHCWSAKYNFWFFLNKADSNR